MANTVGLTLIVIIALAVSRATALKCYQCDSSVDGTDACNDDPANRGELKDCDPSESAGCYIVEVIKGETADVTRGCTGITNEELYKCSAHEVGNQFFTACNCHGEGCNSDWDTAGDTVENPLECYECTSIGFDDEPGGNCSDTHPGGKMRCGPGHTGCFISQSSSSNSKVVTMERGCTMTPCEDRFKCETLDDAHGGTQLRYCNCHGSGCNENWNTADTSPGKTTTSPDSPTTASPGSAAGVTQPTKMLFLSIICLLPLIFKTVA